ncbi:helix-turn-helix transcriptional regulator [Novosphingobium sp. KCTC 2891]|uniref:helix-turn-helix transcriptional regulator n=1 Tax=Novosphingobium sp. KCTC 2891 TaxID=2989730 RepID=UPI00222301C8|nr:helix-turn-helix transcriptional regulator [Novosphingobium sp. KCTC 2891]MCW1384697.1 helix-turn-helix transcriptional regulator [Novosphingobium sp. KCTC 2891]
MNRAFGVDAVQEIGLVRFADPAGVREAATNLVNLVQARLGDWRIAPCANLAAKQPMVDRDGSTLATSVFGWTESEEDRWWRSSRLAIDSPMAQACRYESEPFWCNALGFRTALHNPMLDTVDVSDFDRRALTTAAIVVPVHMPLGVIGAASLVPRDRRMIDLSAPFAEHGDWLAGMIRTFISSYARVMGNVMRSHSEAMALSKREVECLRWAAVGKTNAEIGIIMSRSLATIRFHIHNATTKLNAVNRSQAVYKATQLGYISLNS